VPGRIHSWITIATNHGLGRAEAGGCDVRPTMKDDEYMHILQVSTDAGKGSFREDLTGNCIRYALIELLLKAGEPDCAPTAGMAILLHS
jgi:hypothetical protein